MTQSTTLSTPHMYNTTQPVKDKLYNHIMREHPASFSIIQIPLQQYHWNICPCIHKYTIYGKKYSIWNKYLYNF